MRDHLERKLGAHVDAKPSTSIKKGIGVIGLHEGRTLLRAMNRTSLTYPVAGCDTEQGKIDAVQTDLPGLYTTKHYEEMLARKDVDIVAIYTPDHLHGEHIVRAFEAGKDVICTKPFVNSIGDAKRVLDAARRTGRKLLVGQSTRFFESFTRQRRAFERGEVGELELVDAHYIHRMDWFYEKSAWAATETDWIFLGLSHPIDLVRWYLGLIAEVHAYGFLSQLGRKFGHAGPDVYVVNLRAKDGRIARAMGHYGLHELPTARNCIELMLFGSKGTSQAQYHDMRYRHTNADGTEVTEDPLYELRHYYFNSEIHGMHYGEFATYADYFADALINGTDYSPGLEEGIETFCIMEAARRSVQSGKPVQVAEVMEEAGL